MLIVFSGVLFFMGKTLIIIPAFNESSNIGRVIDGIKELNLKADILVVDDGSSDNTADIAKEKGVKVINLPFNLGYGASLQTGYKYALEHDYDYVVQIDADGQHDPKSIPVLLEEIHKKEVGLVIGSRFLEKNVYNMPYIRFIGIKVFRFVASFFTKQQITDPTSGFQALDKNLLEFFASDVYPADYPDADVLIMLSRAGFKLKEVPVIMHPNLLKRKSMHSGLKPVYYIFKMFLSIFVTLLRREVSTGGFPTKTS